jgi:hypothetical protein
MKLQFNIIPYLLLPILLLAWVHNSSAQSHSRDSIKVKPDLTGKYNTFYDSLKSKAGQKKLTRILHQALFTSGSKKTDSLRNLEIYDGKTIGHIRIVRLPVFGPNVRDTVRKAKLWYERAGNMIHTRTDLHNLRKNLLFREGDTFSALEIYDNERIFRSLPFIRDVRFFVVPDSTNRETLNITMLTQDRFAIGITGDVYGWQSAALELYNRNIFGFGHELSARFVGHLTRQPYTGVETFYRINNLDGRFVTLTAGYMNTYLNEGVMALINKDFLRISSKWGYGAAGHFFKRAHELPGELHMKKNPPIGFNQWSGWAGRNFQTTEGLSPIQITLSAQYIHRHFSQRPVPPPGIPQFYRNTDLYLAGITWSKRTFKTDELIYGYGITEDIPGGFKNEWVFGIDANEAGNRYYSHLFISNANILSPRSDSYLYLAGGFSSYFTMGKISQGLAEMNVNYISRFLTSGNARFRQFLSLNYRLGFNRFEQEKLLFEKNNLTRGFESEEVFGKQRLSISSETVYFRKRDFYRFNLAFFLFADLGILQSESSWIFKGKYYSGVGLGMRLHNESLVLKTLQVRLTFYPNHPEDVGLVGFLLNEQTRQKYWSFQPEPPAPRRFE